MRKLNRDISLHHIIIGTVIQKARALKRKFGIEHVENNDFRKIFGNEIKIQAWQDGPSEF